MEWDYRQISAKDKRINDQEGEDSLEIRTFCLGQRVETGRRVTSKEVLWAWLETVQTYESDQKSSWPIESEGNFVEALSDNQKYIQTICILEPFWRYLGSLKSTLYLVLPNC